MNINTCVTVHTVTLQMIYFGIHTQTLKQVQCDTDTPLILTTSHTLLAIRMHEMTFPSFSFSFLLHPPAKSTEVR